MDLDTETSWSQWILWPEFFACSFFVLIATLAGIFVHKKPWKLRCERVVLHEDDQYAYEAGTQQNFKEIVELTCMVLAKEEPIINRAAVSKSELHHVISKMTCNMCGQMAVACRDKTSGKIVGYQFGRDMFAKLWLFFLNLMADGYTLVNILCSTFMRPGTYKMCQVAHLLHPVLNFSRYRFGHARSGQVLFLGTCVVHPQYRNRGIATKMANMLFEDARKKGFRKVFTWTSTQLAVAQYVKKLRFNVVGSIAYDEVQFNGSRLWRHLTNPVTGEIEKCVHMLDRDL